MKLAAFFSSEENGHRHIVEKMCKAQCVTDDHTYQIYTLECGAIGCINTSDRYSAVPHLYMPASGNILAISGVPLRMQGGLTQMFRAISEMDCQTAANALAKFDGAFAALFWDNEQKLVAIVNDFSGNQPLYQLATGQSLALATDLKGLAASGLSALEIDPVGWGSFLSLGYFVGKHSSLKQVEILEPGSITRFNPRNGARTVQKYWQWREPRPHLKLSQIDTGELVDQLEEHAKACLAHTPHGTLLLSGGFDSRLLLCVLRRAGISAEILIHDHPDENRNADGEYARRIANRFGLTPSTISSPDSFFISDGFIDYLVMNEITTPSLNLFIAQLLSRFTGRPDGEPQDPGGSRTRPAAIQSVWEGVGPGNTLYPCIQTEGGFDNYFKFIMPARDSIAWRAARLVFAPSLVDEMYHGLTAVLAQERARYADDEFGVRNFIMESRVRNRAAANPLKVYANCVLPFTPGLSRDFVNSVNTIPYSLKINLDLYLKLFREQFPEALSVPWCSGGVLIGPEGKINRIHRIYMAADKKGYIETIKRFPLIEGIARQIGRQPRKQHDHPLVGAITARAELGHPDLNGQGIQSLGQGRRSRSIDAYARSLLFYWQVWRWLMEGQVSTLRAAAAKAREEMQVVE